MSHRRRNKSGSILIHMLISLMILSFFLPLAVSAYKILVDIERFPYEVQDQIALAQLRRFLNGCHVVSVVRDELICKNRKTWTLKSSMNHLYLSDGTIIVLQQVDQIYFEVFDGLIWLYYQRDGAWKEALIGQM